MNFYTVASNLYDLLDVTYFRNKAKDPRAVIDAMIYGDDIRVLDLCCGTLSNTIPAAMTHVNAKFYGIDLSKQMLRKARQKIRLYQLENVWLKCADSTESRLSDECFDYIVIGLALHEMDPALRTKVLREAHRLLKRDGRLIVLEWEPPDNFLQWLFFFPLLITEQLLNRSFLKFYFGNQHGFYRDHGFRMNNIVHCSYSAVWELKKIP